MSSLSWSIPGDDHGTHRICKKYNQKLNGKATRVETLWSEYLDEKLGTTGLSSSDTSLVTLGGCQRYRPDKLYIGPKVVEMDECDEYQHTKNSYSCEEKRVSDIYDEDGICGKQLIVTRWNPDKCNDLTIPVPLDQRMEMHVQLKLHLRKHPPSDKIHIFYMFYDRDNPSITKNYPHTFVNSREDFPAGGSRPPKPLATGSIERPDTTRGIREANERNVGSTFVETGAIETRLVAPTFVLPKPKLSFKPTKRPVSFVKKFIDKMAVKNKQAQRGNSFRT